MQNHHSLIVRPSLTEKVLRVTECTKGGEIGKGVDWCWHRKHHRGSIASPLVRKYFCTLKNSHLTALLTNNLNNNNHSHDEFGNDGKILMIEERVQIREMEISHGWRWYIDLMKKGERKGTKLQSWVPDIKAVGCKVWFHFHSHSFSCLSAA